jgi:hypothetical protein
MATLEELDRELPNGFHDAKLRAYSLTILHKKLS